MLKRSGNSGQTFVTIGPFISGVLIGLTIAVPVGPIAVLCVARTLAAGRIAGVVTGIGTATVHAVYGTIGVFSGDFAAVFLHAHAGAMRQTGGALLVCFGLSMLIRPIKTSGVARHGYGIKGSYLSAITVAACNPMTLMGFLTATAAFATPGMNPAQLVGGIVLASTSWYICLCLVFAAVSLRLTPPIIRRFHLFSALLICVSGVTAMVWQGPG